MATDGKYDRYVHCDILRLLQPLADAVVTSAGGSEQCVCAGIIDLCIQVLVAQELNCLVGVGNTVVCCNQIHLEPLRRFDMYVRFRLP